MCKRLHYNAPTHALTAFRRVRDLEDFGIWTPYLAKHFDVKKTCIGGHAVCLLFEPGYYPSVMDAPWALSAQDILQHFGSDGQHGLIEAKVQKHRELYGRNGVPRPLPRQVLRRAYRALK